MITEPTTVKIKSVDDLIRGDRIVLGDISWIYNGIRTNGDLHFNGGSEHAKEVQSRTYSVAELEALLRLRCIQRMVPATIVLSDGVQSR